MKKKNKPLRIAFFTREFPALSETFVLNQATGLVANGHDVTIFAERPRDEPCVHPDVIRLGMMARTRYLDMPQKKLPRLFSMAGPAARVLRRNPRALMSALSILRFGQDAWSLRMLYWAAQLADEGKFDVIHCHFGPVGQLAAKLRAVGVLSGTLATVFHGVDISAYVRKNPNFYDFLFAHGDLFLPISQNWRRQLMSLGCDPRRIEVHHMGVDPNRYCFRPRRFVRGRPLRILTVGRLVQKKGVEYALRAVALLRRRGIPVRYDIVGDGELRPYLERLAEYLGIADLVRFCGWQDQHGVVRQMARSDVLVVPSVTSPDGDQEGIPVTLMEAMASGLLVVATNYSGIPELVESGQSGILVPEGDAGAIADVLGGLMEHPDTWSEMSRAARGRVLEEFEIGKLNRRLIEVYERWWAVGALNPALTRAGKEDDVAMAFRA